MSLPRPSGSAAALVTGASSGLGVELARALARRGFPLVLVARRTELLRDVARNLTSEFGVQVHTQSCDLSDVDARARLAEDISALGLEIAVLVNNAGVGASGRFHELTEGAALRI